MPACGVIFAGGSCNRLFEMRPEGGRSSDCRSDDKAGPKSGGGNPQTPAESPDGVDVTLIRWMLAKSPRERLLATQAAARAILRLRNARSGS